MKYLGLDYGDKKVGLALADSETKIASPYKILTNNKDLLLQIKGICLDEGINRVIVGLPLSLSGNESEQTQKVSQFIDDMVKVLEIEVLSRDERLSSAYAQQLLKDMKVKKIDDDVAAMVILQSYLDECARMKYEG